jgi:DNA-directed RNA polymerase subunit RPC12/RpoP
MKVSNEKKVEYVCSLCGGNNVEAYGRFEWSVRDQLWNAYLWNADYENWCYDCGDQVDLDEQDAYLPVKSVRDDDLHRIENWKWGW